MLRRSRRASRRRRRRQPPPARRTLLSRVFGYERFWRNVMYAVYVRRMLKQVVGGSRGSVVVEKLDPGQSVLVTTIPVVRGKGRVAR